MILVAMINYGKILNRNRAAVKLKCFTETGLYGTKIKKGHPSYASG
jgi:hypothetical protein